MGTKEAGGKRQDRGGRHRETHEGMSVEKQREEWKSREEGEDRRETDTKKKIEKRGKSVPLLRTYTGRIIAIMIEGRRGGYNGRDKRRKTRTRQMKVGRQGRGSCKPGDGDMNARGRDSSRERGKQGVRMGNQQEVPGPGQPCLPCFVILGSSHS